MALYRLASTTVTIAVSLLLAATPVMARGGGHEHGEGDHQRGFEDGHDNGRHRGWYKHQDSFAPTYRYARPWLYRPQVAYPAAWRTPRAWGGSAWPWHRAVIATGAAWGLAWGLGSYFLFQAPPIVYIPPPDELAIPPGVVSVPWMDVPTPFDDSPNYNSPAYSFPANTQPLYGMPAYSTPVDRISDPGPWAAPPPVVFPQRSLLDAAPPPPGVAAPSIYPY